MKLHSSQLVDFLVRLQRASKAAVGLQSVSVAFLAPADDPGKSVIIHAHASPSTTRNFGWDIEFIEAPVQP